MSGEPEGDLLEAARQARDRAYVPYSGFRKGRWFGSSTARSRRAPRSRTCRSGSRCVRSALRCSPRSSLFASVISGRGRPRALALVAPRTDGAGGACLQVALELGGPDLLVVAADSDGDSVERVLLHQLLRNGPRKQATGRLPVSPIGREQITDPSCGSRAFSPSATRAAGSPTTSQTHPRSPTSPKGVVDG